MSFKIVHKLYAIGFHLIFFFLYIFLKTLTNNSKIPQARTRAASRTAKLVCCAGMEINYRVTSATAHPASTGPAEQQWKYFIIII